MAATATDELSAWLRLALIAGIGNVTLRKLLAEFGSPEQTLAASHATLTRLVSGEIASAIRDGGNDSGAQHALAWLADANNQILTLADAGYPRLLLELPDPPLLLYVKGRVELLQQAGLAVVGSRNATPQGITNAQAFSRELSNAGLTIISGLALGIDAAAHLGGLEGQGSTIAVIGTGLDIVYPARNKTLAHKIAAHGALVSEFPLGTPALANNFPRRNRVISGLARGCLVVEAALQSGSLITARLANEQGREVFAIPGSIHSPLAKGCHKLIKQGAKLVDSAQDILEELHLPMTSASDAAASGETATPAETPTTNATPTEMPALNDHGLLKHLGYDPCDLDTLCNRSGLPTDIISATLLELELAGAVQTLPGGRYQRIR